MLGRVLPGAVLVSTTAVAGDELFAVGSAYDRHSGQLLYSEHHYCAPTRTHCVVHYKDTGGELIAQKDLDYRNSNVSPALVMVDFRLDSEVRIPFTANDELVVDAGFDNFVRERWETLSAGQVETFEFQGVGFDSPLAMKIGVARDADCADGQLCLAVNIDSWLLSAFVDPIQLYYSRDDRELLRYSGVSNLRGGGGESMDVDIFYEYRATGLVDTSAYSF